MSETGGDVRWTGIPITAIAAALVAGALTTFGLELAGINALLAVGVNLVAVAGAAPTVMRWRSIPVWRWVVYGTEIGAISSFVALAALAF